MLKPTTYLSLTLSLVALAASGAVRADDSAMSSQPAQVMQPSQPTNDSSVSNNTSDRMKSQSEMSGTAGNSAPNSIGNSAPMDNSISNNSNLPKSKDSAGMNSQPSKSAAAGIDMDSHVLTKLHMTNQEEIKMGKLAQSNSSSPEVKAYGKRLINDHQQVDRKLYDLAASERIMLSNPPVAMNDQEKQEMKDSHEKMDHLSTLKGAEFDREFRRAMIDDHKKDVTELKDTVPQLTSERERNFIQSVIPTIQKHQEMAMKLPTQDETTKS